MVLVWHTNVTVWSGACCWSLRRRFSFSGSKLMLKIMLETCCCQEHITTKVAGECATPLSVLSLQSFKMASSCISVAEVPASGIRSRL